MNAHHHVPFGNYESGMQKLHPPGIRRSKGERKAAARIATPTGVLAATLAAASCGGQSASAHQDPSIGAGAKR
jgi:hypothetical protein